MSLSLKEVLKAVNAGDKINIFVEGFTKGLKQQTSFPYVARVRNQLRRVQFGL